MGSPYERPDLALIADLERLAGAVADELEACRRRTQAAEHEAAALRSRTASFVSGDMAQARQRIADLEDENRALEGRITTAREQLEQLKTRLRFVEEHAGREVE